MAFSLVETLLIVGILGLIAAVFIPSMAKIREKARHDIITEHLQSFVTSGATYISERGVKRVDYKTLVGSKFLKPLESVSGEKYDDLVYDPEKNVVEVSTSYGDKIALPY